MRKIRHLKHHLHSSVSRKVLFIVAFMVLFFVIFDGIIMYLAPIVMQKSGISLGTIGLILGLSSVAGMLFDIILLRVLERASYKIIFFFMFLVALTTPFFLFGGTTVTFYLIAMAAWGLYYNLYDIGSLDFIDQTTALGQETSSFGILKVFEGLGYLIAPFAGSVLLITIDAIHPIPKLIFLFLALSFIFYFIISSLKVSRDSSNKLKKIKKRSLYSMITEVHIWEKVGKVIFPLLLITLVINLIDAAIWTIGPIFSQSLSIPDSLTGGILMLAYTIPPLITGWIVGSLVKKFSKKMIVLGSLLSGSFLLIFVSYINIKFSLIVIFFLVSFFFALIWPTINGAYIDKIEKESSFREEIETIDDWFTNIGDTLGPIMGGYAAELLTVKNSFQAMGILGILITLILIKFTPRDLI